MIRIRPNIIGYHTNDSNRVNEFINTQTPINTLNDTHWLGDGMYFWENKSDALFWKKEKFRKHKTIKKISIAKANIFLDEDKVLNLIDKNSAEVFNKIWLEYSKKRYPNKNSNSIPIGRKINELFNFIDELKDTYKVIKCAGRYVKQDVDVFKFTANCKITQNLKIIYCVRDNSMISNPELVKECTNE